jgi:hypothetical protein
MVVGGGVQRGLMSEEKVGSKCKTHNADRAQEKPNITQKHNTTRVLTRTRDSARRDSRQNDPFQLGYVLFFLCSCGFIHLLRLQLLSNPFLQCGGKTHTVSTNCQSRETQPKCITLMNSTASSNTNFCHKTTHQHRAFNGSMKSFSSSSSFSPFGPVSKDWLTAACALAGRPSAAGPPSSVVGCCLCCSCCCGGGGVGCGGWWDGEA